MIIVSAKASKIASMTGKSLTETGLFWRTSVQTSNLAGMWFDVGFEGLEISDETNASLFNAVSSWYFAAENPSVTTFGDLAFDMGWPMPVFDTLTFPHRFQWIQPKGRWPADQNRNC